MIITWCDVSVTDVTVRQTILAGYVPDQAALHALLNKIRDLILAALLNSLPEAFSMDPYC